MNQPVYYNTGFDISVLAAVVVIVIVVYTLIKRPGRRD